MTPDDRAHTLAAQVCNRSMTLLAHTHPASRRSPHPWPGYAKATTLRRTPRSWLWRRCRALMTG